jgi:hypothetical protein
VAFVIVAVLVVAASGVLAWVLLTRSATSGPGALTSPTPGTTSAPAPAPAPQPAAGSFTSFTVPVTQQCNGHGKHGSSTEAQVAWATANATSVWVVEGTGDAASTGVEQVPLSGDQNSLPYPLELDCSRPSMTFTLTLVGRDGGHVSQTWTVLILGRH